MQTPPVYSALKVAGKRMSDRARAGELVQPTARPVHIQRLVCTAFNHPRFELGEGRELLVSLIIVIII